MRITPIISIILILLVSTSSIYGQCNPKPIADFSVNGFCETDSAIFINLSQNAEYYLWKFGDGKTSNKHSPKYFYHQYHIGNVTLVANDSNGCSDSITKNATMYSNPNSDFSFTINQSEVSFKAKDKGLSSYIWYFGDGDSSTTTSYSYIYNYKKSIKDSVCLKVINAAKCFSKSCKEISLIMGISHFIEPNGFKISPNPNSGSFNVEKTGIKEIVTIEIFNQIGQLLHKEELKDNLNLMHLNLANGIYLIRSTNGENIQNQRIIVSK